MPFACENGWIGGSLIPDLCQIGRKTRPSRPTDVQQAVVLIDYNILLSTKIQMITFRYLPTFNLKCFAIYRLSKCKNEMCKKHIYESRKI